MVLLYLQAVSIADKEVFDFHMVNHVDATEGDAYMDMQIVDTSVTLFVGCIQVIFLNKFVSSVLVSVISESHNLSFKWELPLEKYLLLQVYHRLG